MKNTILTGAICVFACLQTFAQGVLISPNPGNPNPSAGLDIDFTNKGFLLPRVTTLQRNAIVNPAIGLQVYNITTACIEAYFPSGWKAVGCDCSTAPPQPGAITGIADFCLNQQNVTYSVAPVPGASSYTWTVPSGATLVSGQGTTSIVVNFGTLGGNISVQADNSCGTSPATQFVVNPSVPSATFSPLSGTFNIPVSFTPQPGYTSYSWTFQSGSPATSSNQNPQVTWNTAGTYDVTLIVTNVNGCVDTLTQQVVILNCPPSGSQTFSFTGAPQLFIVPACVTSIQVVCFGAQGGITATNGGLGGQANATVQVTPGETLYVYVGGQGGAPAAGWNGGGAGGNNGSVQGGGGGGGSDVRRAGNTLSDRFIVAGGGGGPGNAGGGVDGGHGGGVNGDPGPLWSGTQSGGGTQSSGGVGGTYTCSLSPAGQPGGFGFGGAGGICEVNRVGGGGGGGWYGGGGSQRGSGAGGGSGYVNAPGNSNTSMQVGVRAGNGEITISW